MPELRLTRSSLIRPVSIILYLSIFKFLLQVFTNGRFGYHRDELYYIACSRHLAPGYVDHPPLIAFLARIWIDIFGSSLFSLRFLPAVAAAGIVFLTGVIVRELGGKTFAIILACLSVIIAPVFLSTDRLFTTNVFDQLFWISIIYLVIKILKYERPRLWIGVGILTGFGLLNKHSVLFLILGLSLGMLFTAGRKHFRNKNLWIGAGLAFLIFLPNLIWQIGHGWPTIEFLKGAEINRVMGGSLFAFIGQVIFSYHPLTLPIWAAGFYFLLVSKNGGRYRALGIFVAAIFVCFGILKSKDYYLAPVFPLLWAAGSVQAEYWLRKIKTKILRPAIMAILFLGGAVLAPLSIPILPFDATAAYCDYLQGGMHPVYSDMLGWERMVRTVADVYYSLPESERRSCAIMTQNYGEAAAIDFFGPAYRLPGAISPHNSFWLWGYRNYSGKILITVGISPQGLERAYENHEVAAEIVNKYATSYENNLPVIIWRNPRYPMKVIWPMIRLYY